MRTTVIVAALCLALAFTPTNARSMLDNTNYCSLDMLKAICTQYSNIFNADPNQLPDDCTIRGASQRLPPPSPQCCYAVAAFLKCGCNPYAIAVNKLALTPQGCPGIGAVCASLGECSAT